MSIQNKKLLFLGGAVFQVPAIKCARDNGCHVILADLNENAPGREFADVFEKVSTRDAEPLLEVAKRHHIDGVMTYASDSSVRSVAFIADALKLPGNPIAAAEMLSRKDSFREFQKAAGLPHPDFAVIDHSDQVPGALRLKLPIVVKPVDSAGTKGQTVIYTPEEAAAAFHSAIQNSKVGKVIFEEFLKADMMELDGDIFVQAGKLAFRHYGHNYFLKNRISNVPSGEIFPGLYGSEITSRLDGQFHELIERAGIRSGSLNFDGIVSGGVPYIIDIGLRAGGNFVPELIQLSTGCNLTEAAVYAALGVPYHLPPVGEVEAKTVASYLIATRFPGVLESVDFDAEILPYMETYRAFFKQGDFVNPYTRSDHAIGCLFLKFDDVETMRKVVDQVEDLVQISLTPLRDEERAASDANGVPYQVDPNAYKNFPELIAPFLRSKLEQARLANDEVVLRVLSKQYAELPEEYAIRTSEGLKHYEASADVYFEGKKLSGVERLYQRVILVEPLYQCIAHCRYCLRRNYDPFNQSREDLRRIARYIGSSEQRDYAREVLITGGDPFLAPDKVRVLLDGIAEDAPQIKIVRVATRVPIHQPDRVNEKILSVIGAKYPFRVEVATQINHAAELFPEVEEAYRRVLDSVRVVYNQTVLLKGVNDSVDELVDLFDALRYLGIENHYIFHCVPIGGLNHLRTPLLPSIQMLREASMSGRNSGRVKPKICLMTSIGKIMPYEGAILETKGNRHLLRSEYRFEDRKAWNPRWKLPPDVLIDADGFLCVWYEDAAPE